MTLDEIVDSIKGCWVSMFKDHILDYATHFEGYVPGKMSTPTMGVLIMKMVEAQSSGVCFSRNIWGDNNEAMIEAVLGQGEGLVCMYYQFSNDLICVYRSCLQFNYQSITFPTHCIVSYFSVNLYYQIIISAGAITPDRFVVDKYSTNVCYSDISIQTKKFVRASNEDGVEMITLDDPHEGPVLTDQMLTKLTNLARSIEEYYNAAQDIEWAVDNNGRLYVLQSRPITTANSSSSLSFIPPGDGFWTFDPTHFPRPLTKWMENSSMDLMSHNSRRVGSLLKSIKQRTIHGYSFSQPEHFPPSDIEKLERAAKAYWEKKLYEEDYQEFIDFFRPDCERLRQELRIIDPSVLSHPSLVKYVAKCYDYAVKFWKLHHVYTMPCMVVVGDFMNRMAKLTGNGTMETLQLLEGASPESRGMLNKNDPELGKMYNLLKQNEKALELLKCDENMAKFALDCLLHLPGELGELLRKVSFEYGWRLTGGYDLCVPAMIETPYFFIKTLQQGVEEDDDLMEKNRERVVYLTSEWRESVPEEKREEFDEILEVGRRFFRMRDERGLCTDLTGVALCRRGILEAGRRLTHKGIINAPDHLTCATKNEAISLLTGDFRGLTVEYSGPVDVPTASKLESRFLYIKNADPSKVPKSLGVPPPPPPDVPLPPNIARTMANLHTGLIKGLFDETSGSEEDVSENPDCSVGISASTGKVTGKVTVVLQDSDLQLVQKGDIVVTYSASASFNFVLALCSGIVTNYGGMLSHAAIVAREFGIPAIVGTQDSTYKFRTGDIVTIDSNTHSVTRVQQQED